ncbi:efflux RND transporter periplasmic adaptor subunit [Aureliella helgolandensis]|uniref:Macrolide transporter subunit MacA n=1 Tax=Aureliella helgolandensis TaxID=2527968 RepID=A0A518G0I5_9BACT|nr:HlyD family efflux transporter periplasmic adaptor subunit [Aureliella helgolandensis]QDV22050.1 macrolide transporter subunit MacA [Aureliella helgolandensis]
MSIRHKIMLLVGSLVVVSFSTTAFSQETRSASPSRATYSDSTITIEGALVKVIHEIEVAAQADGLIQQMFAEAGQTVAEGERLIKIDDRIQSAEVQVAAKELEAAKKQAKQVADIEFAEASYKVSQAEFEDIVSLLSRGASSESERRRAELEKEKGRLGVDVARIKKEQEQLAADVSAEKLHAAEVRLGLYEVLAPLEGVITERMRDRGEWIRSGEPILKLVHLNEMRIEAQVPVEQISPSELQGAPMTISVRVSPQFKADFQAQVEFVSPYVNAGEVMVWAKVKNQRVQPGGPWLLRDGMHADVQIQRR